MCVFVCNDVPSSLLYDFKQKIRVLNIIIPVYYYYAEIKSSNVRTVINLSSVYLI